MVPCGYRDSVVRQKSLYFVCHSGFDPESTGVKKTSEEEREKDAIRDGKKN